MVGGMLDTIDCGLMHDYSSSGLQEPSSPDADPDMLTPTSDLTTTEDISDIESISDTSTVWDEGGYCKPFFSIDSAILNATCNEDENQKSNRASDHTAPICFSTPSSLPTFVNAAIALSRWWRSCAAEIWTRMRAWPFATTG